MGLQRFVHFELVDGTQFSHDPKTTASELLVYTSACARADYFGESRPEPPEVLRACAQAKDREAAFVQLYPNRGSGPDRPALPIVPEALIERGELVPRSLP
jgi:hypothetical protein